MKNSILSCHPNRRSGPSGWPLQHRAQALAKAIWLTLLGASCLLITTVAASAQPSKALKEQLIGSWRLASIINTRVDGTRHELFGPEANGILMLDGHGRYSLQIIRRGRPAFVGARMEGTAEENKAAVQGMISHFGTYSLNEAERSLTFRITSSSYPNWDGSEQTRKIVLLVDQLSWSDPPPASGPDSTDVRTDVVWQRISGPGN